MLSVYVHTPFLSLSLSTLHHQFLPLSQIIFISYIHFNMKSDLKTLAKLQVFIQLSPHFLDSICSESLWTITNVSSEYSQSHWTLLYTYPR